MIYLKRRYKTRTNGPCYPKIQERMRLYLKAEEDEYLCQSLEGFHDRYSN
jgi:hypothetical protein